MDLYKFEDYQKKVREAVLKKQHEPEIGNHEIMRLIDELQESCWGNSCDEAFINAERHFYHCEYEQALKSYLEAKEVPGFQFYCYRVSSIISKEREEFPKALSFAQKASKIDPQDPIVQQLIYSLREYEGVTPKEEIIPSALVAVQDTSLLFENAENHSEELFAHEIFLESGNHRQTQIQQILSGSLSTTEVIQAVESCIHHTTAPSSFLVTSEEKISLEQSIQLFQQAQIKKMQAYLQSERKSQDLRDDALYVLNGWPKEYAESPFLLTEESRKTCGGHFLRWNEKGIAINPGPGFLENFHSQGLCIRDIDYVVVTRDSYESYGDVKAIAELQFQLNKTAPERQLIHYYLHHRTYQALASYLKPSFKQARNTIHKLEMFLDSPDVEKIELEEGIILHYFLTSMHAMQHSHGEYLHEKLPYGQHFGIRLELTNEEQKLHIGYLSGLAWSPLISHHLSYCDIILAAFGNTCVKDYSMVAYNEDSLGYFGILTLLQQQVPKLLLLSEFGGREGDIRLEVAKKMRKELTAASLKASTLLPADIGLKVDLKTLGVKCSLSTGNVAPAEVMVAASSESYGRLSYLSPRFCVEAVNT